MTAPTRDTFHRQGYRQALAESLRRGSQERDEVIRALLTADRDSEEYRTAASVGRRLIGEER